LDNSVVESGGTTFLAGGFYQPWTVSNSIYAAAPVDGALYIPQIGMDYNGFFPYAGDQPVKFSRNEGTDTFTSVFGNGNPNGVWTLTFGDLWQAVDLGLGTLGGWCLDLTLNLPLSSSAPTIGKAFSPASIPSGGTSVVTLTLTNSNASALTGGAFSDTLVNMSALGGAVGGTCAGTTPATLTTGATVLSFSGITIPAGSSCTVTFSVTSTTTGVNPNTTSGVTTTQTPMAGAASNTATLTLGALADGPFLVHYSANLNIGESYIDIINTGASGASPQGPGFGAQVGDICANVYAFDSSEELISCCSCLITPDQTVDLGVVANLTAKTLTGVVPTSVTVKVLSTLAAGAGSSSCTNSAATASAATIVTGMAAWGTTLHAQGASYAVTETPFTPSTLSAGELASITGRCSSILGNGSSFGVCTSCKSGALGASKNPQ
jgi:hypothetical protein